MLKVAFKEFQVLPHSQFQAGILKLHAFIIGFKPVQMTLACSLVVKVLYHSLLEYIQRRLQTLIKATKFQNDHESNCNKHQN